MPHDDIEQTIREIAGIVKRYGRSLEKFKEIKKPGQKQISDMLSETRDYKMEFIEKKKLCRSLIELIDKSEQESFTSRLEELQVKYREFVAEKQKIISIVEHEILLPTGAGTGILPKTNDEYLHGAQQLNQKTTDKLKDGLTVVQATIEIGAATAAQLVEIS